MECDLSKATDDGVLLVDKPAGWTSFDVVAKIRGQLRQHYAEQGVKPTKRQLRVGHAGTLDPFATGLLIILLGDATKKAGDFLKLDKTYEATIRLGEVSTTGDPEGEMTPTIAPSSPHEADIEYVLERFTGTITQTPPKFSAIKVGGQRAYKLARQGKDVEVPPRQVTIYSIEQLGYAYPDLRVRTHVSSGTYIRTLAQDIGEALGTGAYCLELRRCSIAEYRLSSDSRATSGSSQGRGM